VIFDDIEEQVGKSNALNLLARLDSQAGDNKSAELRFATAHDLLEEIDDRVGLRANWGYLGEHYNRHDQLILALKAYQASLEVLPRVADDRGYQISLRGQCDAFAKVNNIAGILACLLILSEEDEAAATDYSRIMDSLEGRISQEQFDELKKGLSENPDEVRLAMVQNVLAQDSETTDTRNPDNET